MSLVYLLFCIRYFKNEDAYHIKEIYISDTLFQSKLFFPCYDLRYKNCVYYYKAAQNK